MWSSAEGRRVPTPGLEHSAVELSGRYPTYEPKIKSITLSGHELDRHVPRKI
jgi:hypothetical protein